MKQEQFEALVRRLESYARERPGGYRARVGLLAALGYVYIFAVLAVLLAILGLVGLGLATGKATYALGKIGWIVGVLVLIILRALWVRLSPPEGIALRREQVPRLFEMVDELTTALEAPRFHHVLLTDDLNAAVAQVPRLGLFGWQRNYLVLGLPLMQALSADQFRAVVAHELGHLSGNHSRFAGWIYRVRQTWYRLLEGLETQRHGASFIFERFFHWYAPYFSAYSFALARADEYVADRCAAELAGAQAAAEALVTVEVKDRFLGTSYWPAIYKQAEQQPEPPPTPFAGMARALLGEVAAEDARRWLGEALAEKTGYANTHPSLSDRLAALGYPTPETRPDEVRAPPLPPPFEESAAQRLLGKALDHFTVQLEHAWREGVAFRWQERYRYVQETRKSLAALEQKVQHGPLSDEEAWDRARWTAELEGDETALPLFQEIVAAHPDHPAANYALGQILLERGDAAGIGHIERAMEQEPGSVLPGCQLIYHFLKRQGRDAEAETYRERAERQYVALMKAQQERSAVSPRDRFQPHGLPAEAIQRLREQLARDEHVGAAYLVRKVVSGPPDRPFYVLGIAPHYAWNQLQSETRDEQLAERIAAEVELPGEAVILLLTRDQRPLARALRKIEGAPIYHK